MRDITVVHWKTKKETQERRSERHQIDTKRKKKQKKQKAFYASSYVNGKKHRVF